MRLVDASISNDDICSFPTYSLYAFNFTRYAPNRLPYRILSGTSSDPYDDKAFPINLISCPNPLTNSSIFTDVTSHCDSNSSHHKYAYIKVGHMNASEVPYTCGVDLIAMTSWYNFKDLNNVSLSEIHESLLYGFELRICPSCGPSQNFNVFGKQRVHSVTHIWISFLYIGADITTLILYVYLQSIDNFLLSF